LNAEEASDFALVFEAVRAKLSRVRMIEGDLADAGIYEIVRGYGQLRLRS
jgi:hypothetical protein